MNNKVIYIVGSTQQLREQMANIVASLYAAPEWIDVNFADLLEPDMCALKACKVSTDLLVFNHIGINRLYVSARLSTGHLAVKRHGRQHFFFNPDRCFVCSDRVNESDIVEVAPPNTYLIIRANEVVPQIKTIIGQ